VNPEHVPVDGGVLAVPGLTGAADRTGVKPSGSPDLAVVVADRELPAAAMFTTCATAAANIVLGRRTLEQHQALRSVVVNSGNANALTGAQGMRDAEAIAAAARRSFQGPALVLSTGVIGVPLPVGAVLQGLERVAGTLRADADEAVAQAFLTTDTCDKRAALQVTLPSSGRRVTVGGTAKGSGMIHPNMATMLAVMATDAPVDAEALDAILRHAVDRSFHEITVDGDTSTSDAVVLLGRPTQGEPLDATDLDALQRAVVAVARSLAGKILADGEGMTRILDLHVTEAATPQEARAVATSVATSSLVKTALAGGDPNWGRILAAAGNAGVPVEPDRLTLWLEGIEVFRKGEPLEVDRPRLEAAFRGDHVHAELRLGRGAAATRMRTTDLTHRYVEINAEYTT